MLYTVKSSKIKAVLNSLGACATSLVRLSDGKELLWQGDEKIWSGQAPTLFPIIGRMKDGAYEAEGERFTIKNHGFARASEFTAVQEDERAVVFTLSSSEETRKYYPYDFTFSVRYEADGGRLVKSHTMTNTSDKALCYEVGGHEGYNVSLLPGEAMEDYYIEFPGSGSPHTLLSDKDVMITHERKALSLTDGRLPLNMELFKDDALILDDVKGARAVLGGKKSGAVLEVEFGGFPYLGIWTKYLGRNTDYVCIEPWTSLPDCNYLDYKLENKVGVRRLEAGASETLTYSVVVY